MRTQTTGRALVLTGIGIVLVAITISALWTWNPNKAVWEDWILVAGWWLATVGFWALLAYSVWVDLKHRPRWFPAIGGSVLVVSSILFFAAGPVIGEVAAFLGLAVAAAIAYWDARQG